MSLEQKAGQLMIIAFAGTVMSAELRDTIRQLHTGGVILYDWNIESPDQLAKLIADLQDTIMKNGDPALFVMIDQEGGSVARLKAKKGFTEFPSQMAITATGNIENARVIARSMALEMRAVGINVNLAPNLDVNKNAMNPVVGIRSYSSDPIRVAEYGTAFIESLQELGILSIGKHFPGHGDTNLDSHISLPSVIHDRARLESVELVPFKAAINTDIAGIMLAHVTFPAIEPTLGLPATLSKKVVTGLLRGEMEYTGLVITDELTMGALANNGYPPPKAAATALMAGADLLLIRAHYDVDRQVHQIIMDCLKREEISFSSLENTVSRILMAKQRFGILDARKNNSDAVSKRVGLSEARRFSYEIATSAITLVRDFKRLLPINVKATPLVVETSEFGLGKSLGVTTIQVSAKPTQNEIASVLARTQDNGAVIVATTDVAENRSQANLVGALCQSNRPTIVVAMGSPYDLLYMSEVPTYIATYGNNPSTINALSAILTGNTKARGRLPIDLPGLHRIDGGLTE